MKLKILSQLSFTFNLPLIIQSLKVHCFIQTLFTSPVFLPSHPPAQTADGLQPSCQPLWFQAILTTILVFYYCTLLLFIISFLLLILPDKAQIPLPLFIALS